MSVRVRPATARDITAFYPEQTCSFRALVAELDGEVQGVIGLALTRPTAGAFSAFREPLRPYLRHPAILRAIKATEAMIKASRVPVMAIAEELEPTAPGILQRLGARYIGTMGGKDYYGWGL
jgi:hypothetical protein